MITKVNQEDIGLLDEKRIDELAEECQQRQLTDKNLSEHVLLLHFVLRDHLDNMERFRRRFMVVEVMVWILFMYVVLDFVYLIKSGG